MSDEIKQLFEATAELMEAAYDLWNTERPGQAIKMKFVLNSAEDTKTMLTNFRSEGLEQVAGIEKEFTAEGEEYYIMTVAMKMVGMQKLMNVLGRKEVTAAMIQVPFTEDNHTFYDNNKEELKEAMEKDKHENIVNGNGTLQ